MELVTVRLPEFGSGAFCAGSCAAAGRASTKEHATVSASRHTNFDTNDFEFIDPPLDMRVERGRASAPVAHGRARWTPLPAWPRRSRHDDLLGKTWRVASLEDK